MTKMLTMIIKIEVVIDIIFYISTFLKTGFL